jgi:two-component system, NtrC family, nitrogen regulation sensor histidine kinase GlnL
MEHQRKLLLKGYVFHCLLYRVTANILIQPLLTPKAVKGAAITVSHVSACGGRRPEDVHRLIAMGKTASSLAHGVRNPLNAIKGAVTFVSQKYAQEKVLMEFAKVMHEEISRLDNFISRFLTTSMPDTGLTLVDINALLKKIEILISFQTSSRNIRCDFHYGTIPPVLINLFQLEQAILNVINNAIEAIVSDGELTVKTLSEKASEKDFIVIEVSDDGPGMPGDRSAKHASREKMGKGFGLIITEEIMHSFCGHMDIKSRKGKGTSVRLYVPAAAAGGTNEEKRQG